MRDFLLNLVAALSYAGGAIFMKASNGLRQPRYAVLVYVCFAFGATLQAVALQRQQVGVSNTIVLGVEAISAFAMSVILLGEPVTAMKLAAIGLVGAGVYLLRG
jgi:quaternary ammonium compound-resistance protein SugE